MSTAPHRPPPSDSLSRIGRITLKELRETLRDRRTIVTLVLMPLLVYPLLSLAFKQFLLSSAKPPAQMHWKIGAESDEQLQEIREFLSLADAVHRQRPPASQETPPASADSPGDQPSDKPSLDRVLGTVVAGSLETAVARHDVDLGLRLSPRDPADPKGPFSVELVYRSGADISEGLADFVERRLQAYNDSFAETQLKQLGVTGGLPARWQLRPVQQAAEQTTSLATLVPLILILMTITGAVYPAIDLTAGERERGTLEALMAAPVPRLSLLFAKYIAVLTVAMLTALANIMGMTITVLSSGLGPLLFGERGLSLGAVAVVFCLLVLFAAFFSAVLLCVTSFARSFKEAQAYLIPLMLVSLAPGFLSVMPDLKLNAWLAVAPLANIVLLARDVLAGTAHPTLGFIAVVTTCLYGAAALGLAARIFGSDSILYGSQNSWRDLVRPPAQRLPSATLAGSMACLALIVPLYVVLGGFLSQLSQLPMATQLLTGAGMLLVLFVGIPLLLARLQGVELIGGFQLRAASLLAVLGAIVLGCSLAPLAYELIIVSQSLGIATITPEQLAEKAPLVARLAEQWRRLSPALVLLAVAFVPAIAEELFFRGYLLGSMRGRLPAWLAIAFTALVFGLFHASVGGIIAVERVLSSMSLGLVLGWVCWSTRSVLPGMLLHALNNAIVVSLAYWGDGLKGLGIDVENQRHLPPLWLLCAGLSAAGGAALVFWGRRANRPLPTPHPSSTQPSPANPG